LPKAIGKSLGFKLSTALEWSFIPKIAASPLPPAAFEVTAGITDARSALALIPLLPSFPSNLNQTR
jgi:hypothetical protein